jgi:hypothetical protein
MRRLRERESRTPLTIRYTVPVCPVCTANYGMSPTRDHRPSIMSRPDPIPIDVPSPINSVSSLLPCLMQQCAVMLLCLVKLCYAGMGGVGDWFFLRATTFSSVTLLHSIGD